MNTDAQKGVDWTRVSEKFMLAPDEIYLNAGTFSALPRAVYDAQIRHMAEADLNPTRRAAWNRRDPMWAAQKAVAGYLGADPNDIVLHYNITQAMNQAIFCLPWPDRGEFLVSDLEYGAIVNAVREMCRRRGLTVRVFKLPRDPRSTDELAEAILSEAGPQAVGMLLSHVISATGMVTPVERIGAALRQRGVRLLVDGAHGPGLLPLSLAQTEIDIYAGNFHKWFLGPKGTGFLYVARRLQESMQPHIVGWGGATQKRVQHSDELLGGQTPFQAVFCIQGLMDASPFLALTATLEFRRSIGEEAIRARIGELLAHARQRLSGDLGLTVRSPRPGMHAGLTAFEVPFGRNPREMETRLFTEHHITIAGWTEAPGLSILRVSAHIWNSPADIDRLAEALRKIMG